MTDTAAIALFCHESRMLSSGEMMDRYRSIEQICNDLSLTPTFFSADDGRSRGAYRKANGSLQKRFIGAGSVGFQGFHFAANPQKSDAPAFDSYFTIGLSGVPEAEIVFVSISIDEPYLSLGSEQCDHIVRAMSDIWPWDYGFGLSRPKESDPLLLILDADSGRHNSQDLQRLNKWYACQQPEQRRMRIRDIYPYNIVGPGHLAYKLPDSRTLREFISSDADSKLTPLTDRLWQWKVSPEKTEIVREKLLGTGVIISE